MSTPQENDESFFLELEKAAKLLSVADGRITSEDLRALFADLRASDADPSGAGIMTYVGTASGPLGAPLPLDVAGDSHPADFIVTLLSISKSTRALSALMLGDIGLHVGQDQLLAALDIKRPISVSAVSDVLNVRPSTVSKMTDRLVAKGLIERGLDKGDARRTVLRLTTAGAAKLVDVQALWQK